MDGNKKRFYSLNQYLKDRFGQKVYKLSLNGGMTCPNRDGKIDNRGCIFCSKGGSGEFASDKNLSITKQIETAKIKVANKIKNGKYIAYFQAFTNTYAPLPYLEKIFFEAIKHPDIVALSIATRPDCLPKEVLDLLERLNIIKPVWIELGLQTIHDDTAKLIRRGYDIKCFEEATQNLKNISIETIIHIIIGLPHETKEMLLETIHYISKIKPEGIKLQLLHVLKNTDLENYFLDGNFQTLSMEEYIDLLILCIESLPKDIVVHRITGDSPHGMLVAPAWSEYKWTILNTINKEMEKRDSFQGKNIINETTLIKKE